MKCLIWDFDGTLGFRHGMWSGTFIEILDREMPGHGVALEEIRPWTQKGFPWHSPEVVHSPLRDADRWWRDLHPVIEQGFRHGARLNAEDARRLAGLYRQEYLNPSRWQLFEDTAPCLAALADHGWDHYMLSNHVPELNTLLSSLGIRHFLKRVFNSAETGFLKPHPMAFKQVLAAIPSADRIFMIGDNYSADVLGAENVGLEAILVRSNHPQARCRCEQLIELEELLKPR